MNIVAPSSSNAAEFSQSVRADRASEQARGAVRGSAEFSSLLSKLSVEQKGAAEQADSADPKLSKSDKDDRAETEPLSTETKAGTKSYALVDPIWSLAFMRPTGSVADAAPDNGGGELSDASRSATNLQTPPDATPPTSLDRALAVATRAVGVRSAGEHSALDGQSARASKMSLEADSSIASSAKEQSSDASTVTAKAPSVDSEGAAETIRDVKIQSLETHLPVALGDMLAGQARQSFYEGRSQVANIDIAPTTTADKQFPSVGATKLLTIELEPASLGSVTVRMKMSRSSIDMQIRVDSLEALRTLDATRDKLVDAIQSSGCAVDSCTIRVDAAASADNSQVMTNGGDRSRMSDGSGASRQELVGREGQNNGGGNGAHRDDFARGAEEAQRDIAPRPAGDRNVGLYL